MEPLGALLTEFVNANPLEHMVSPWDSNPRPLPCQKARS